MSTALSRMEFYGELALGGELKPVKGLLLASAHAAQAGHEIDRAARRMRMKRRIATGAGVRAARHLKDVCGASRGSELLSLHCGQLLDGARSPRLAATCTTFAASSGEARARHCGGWHAQPSDGGAARLGQEHARAAPARLAAAAHLSGSTRSGEDRLRERQRIRRSGSSGGVRFARLITRPRCIALVGGGRHARPGEVSLAHRGVLFLDELPEFERRALEALREPLETGVVAVSRVAMQAEYPAEFQLVAAMNPCPCGYRGDPDGRCTARPAASISTGGVSPARLLDRIDLRIEVPTIATHELADANPAGESTAEVLARVLAARARQLTRSSRVNSRLTITELGQFCRLDSAGERLFWQTQSRLGISARSYHRVLRVARTIADLEDSPSIQARHVAEALQLRRALDRGPAN